MSHLPMNYFGALKAAVDTPFLLAFLGLFCLALTSFSYANLLDLGTFMKFSTEVLKFLFFLSFWFSIASILRTIPHHELHDEQDNLF